jgi:hypothetical protein
MSMDVEGLITASDEREKLGSDSHESCASPKHCGAWKAKRGFVRVRGAPNNSLQPDRGLIAVPAEPEKTRLGRGG